MIAIGEPRLFDEAEGDESPRDKPVLTDADRAERIAAAADAQQQGIRAHETSAARQANSVQADLGGRGAAPNNAEERPIDTPPSGKISESTKAIGRRGITEARAVLDALPRREDTVQNDSHTDSTS